MTPNPTLDADMSRRSFLQRIGAGAGTILIATAAGGLIWRSIDQHVLDPATGPAYEPWHTDLDAPAPLSLVAAAILAASAHNTQPWAFVVRHDRIDLFADRSRSMGTMDPRGRELLISIGCALENLVLAARAHGLAPAVDLRSDPTSPDLVATIGLSPSIPEVTPLYQAIPRRHTNRAAYDTTRNVPPDELAEMSALADGPDVKLTWLTSDDDRRRFGQMTVDATTAILADPDQARDDFAWYRQGWEDIERYQDGITMDAAGLGEPVRTILRLLPASSQEQMQRGWLDATRDRHVATAAAYGLIHVRQGNDPAGLAEAGRLLQRAHLHATTRGLAMQPLNQVFERVDREISAGGDAFTGRLRSISVPGWDVVTGFRIGYPTAVATPSPRRSVSAVSRAAAGRRAGSSPRGPG